MQTGTTYWPPEKSDKPEEPKTLLSELKRRRENKAKFLEGMKAAEQELADLDRAIAALSPAPQSEGEGVAAFVEGRLAYHGGRPGNPYELGTPDGDAWHAGFVSAADDARIEQEESRTATPEQPKGSDSQTIACDEVGEEAAPEIPEGFSILKVDDFELRYIDGAMKSVGSEDYERAAATYADMTIAWPLWDDVETDPLPKSDEPLRIDVCDNAEHPQVVVMVAWKDGEFQVTAKGNMDPIALKFFDLYARNLSGNPKIRKWYEARYRLANSTDDAPDEAAAYPQPASNTEPEALVTHLAQEANREADEIIKAREAEAKKGERKFWPFNAKRAEEVC